MTTKALLIKTLMLLISILHKGLDILIHIHDNIIEMENLKWCFLLLLPSWSLPSDISLMTTEYSRKK